jgi:hypothetical protein
MNFKDGVKRPDFQFDVNDCMQLPNEAKPGTVPPVNTDGVCHHFGKSAAHFSKMLEWKQEILNAQIKSAGLF